MILDLAAIFLPLFGFLIAGLFGRMIGHNGAIWVTCSFMVTAALISVWLFIDIALNGNARTVVIAEWLSSGDMRADWALRLDTLSAVMLIVVNGVSALVHIYSVGYMSHDPNKGRFFAYLSLFTFMMLMLVTADNLLQMFFGWEGVGLASYLLIGFWYHKESANHASLKAFIMNRVGDFGFLLGIFATFMLFDSIEFDVILDPTNVAALAGAQFEFLGMQVHALTTIGLLLFIGAMGKSAQLGLHTWLPDAMEGPTPVSALIHAATMVTAGVFMLCRMSPVLEYAPDALAVITVIGALTAIMAATIGMTQFDIKRVIAYSTMSQLGYMFFAVGVSAYSAAMFHLMTHAFFKALLFLGAGSVIHAMSDEQDMRNMGGIWKLIPQTYALMWIGSLALAGIGIYSVFGFAGFYSKDIILEAVWADNTPLGVFTYWIGILAAVLTAFYSWRLLLMSFHGKPRADEETMAHIHESPPVMLVPLYILAIGAVFAGFVAYDYFVYKASEDFWAGTIFVLPENDTVAAAHDVALWVKLAPVGAGLVGIGLAYLLYMMLPSLPGQIAKTFSAVNALFFNRWYFDALYRRLFVLPARYLGLTFWKVGDVTVIDNVGPNGVAAMVSQGARRLVRLQSGYLYHYAFAMLIGVVLLLGLYLFGGDLMVR